MASRIVRLAHARPDFRPDLQPLLYVIAAKDDESKEGEKKFKEQKEFTKLMGHGPRFGVVSAHRPGASRQKNNILKAKLIADLKTLGYRKVSPMRGKWELLPEDSLLISNVRHEDLFELGRRFKQKYVIYQQQPGLLGFYYTTGEPRARIIVNPRGDTDFRSVSDMTPYSRGKGLDLEWGLLWSKTFPWDGRNTLTRKQIRSMLKRDELAKGTKVTD